MLKRTMVIGTVLAVLVAMGPLAAFAQTPAASPKDTTKPAVQPTPAAKPVEAVKPEVKPVAAVKPVAVTHTANAIAVCACGKVFIPDANTKYIMSGGKKYACCSDECHKTAMADPAKATKMAEDNMAKVLAQLNPPTPSK